jgi:predicted ATPase
MWGRRNQKVKWKGEELKLTDAVNKCIKCMGLAQEIEPSKTGKLIYQIKVKIPIKSKSVTIADVGFGYSQIIPIVLTGLLNDSRNLMLIEQPDLINRLRLRVIEDPSLKDKINIVFIDTDDSGASVARQYSIDENGGFPEWPTGFLDESEKAARAIIKARVGRSENKLVQG